MEKTTHFVSLKVVSTVSRFLYGGVCLKWGGQALIYFALLNRLVIYTMKGGRKMDSHNKKLKKSSFFIDKKDTVAAPWPTGRELLNDPEVQKEIKKVKEAFKNYQSINKKSGS